MFMPLLSAKNLPRQLTGTKLSVIFTLSPMSGRLIEAVSSTYSISMSQKKKKSNGVQNRWAEEARG